MSVRLPAPDGAVVLQALRAACGTFIFTRPDGAILPNCPPLPETHGDIRSQHQANITAHTIIPVGLADKFDLDLTIWASFANARLAQERAQAQEPAVPSEHHAAHE
jgi:hypothetical protein